MRRFLFGLMVPLLLMATAVFAQAPPTPAQIATYVGIHKAAHEGDVGEIARLAAEGVNIDERDGAGRTAVHIAAFARRYDALTALSRAGADMNALDAGRYDAVTIAAVADDAKMVKTAINAGNRPDNITSIWDGNALIAAAHEGNFEPIDALIEGGSSLDHVNSLGWTAVIEAIVLGDGGERHQKSLKRLLDAGADRTIADRAGKTPLELARERGYAEMVALLGG